MTAGADRRGDRGHSGHMGHEGSCMAMRDDAGPGAAHDRHPGVPGPAFAAALLMRARLMGAALTGPLFEKILLARSPLASPILTGATAVGIALLGVQNLSAQDLGAQDLTDDGSPAEAPAPETASTAGSPENAATVQDGGVIVSHGIATFNADILQLPADFTHLPYVNPDAPKGGQISMQAVLDGYDSMNPFSVKGRAAQGASMMLETILTGTADEIGTSYCLMCTTMEYPEDRSWVIFNLREDVRFSDGSALTSEDVVFSYQTFLTKGLAEFRPQLEAQVASVEAIGPWQVKYTFNPGVPTRDLPAMAGSLPVLSKAHYEANGMDLEESSRTPFLGSGAYVPEALKSPTSISYRRNPDYWAKDLPFGKGRYNYDVIRYEYFGEANAAFEGFKGGAYTFRLEHVARQWSENYNFPAVQNGTVKREELAQEGVSNGQSWVFNLRRAKWSDPRVREAVSILFNFEWSNHTLFYGQYHRINSFWENSWLAAEGAPTPEEAAILQPLVDEGLLAASILTDPPYSQPLARVERQADPALLRQAAALLDEAGWEVRPPPSVRRMSPLAGILLTFAAAGLVAIVVTRPRFAGKRLVAGGAGAALVLGLGWWSQSDIPGPEDGLRRNAAGEVLTLEFLDDNPTFERVLAPFVSNLRAVGIDASIDMIDSAQYEVRTRGPDYDFDVTGSFFAFDYYPGSELKQWLGSGVADVSTRNLAGLRDPAVDRLIEVIMAAQSRDEVTAAIHAMDRVLRADRFRIPMWHKPQSWVAYYDMYEHPAELPPYATGELSWWWVNPEKEAALKASGVLRQ